MPHEEHPRYGHAAWALGLLTALNLCNFIDRYVLPGVQPLIQHDRLARQAQSRAPHAPVAHQPHGDVGGGIDPDGEAQPLGMADHRRVDADDFPLPIYQRAAGIAGIERRIGLDDALNQPAGR